MAVYEISLGMNACQEPFQGNCNILQTHRDLSLESGCIYPKAGQVDLESVFMLDLFSSSAPNDEPFSGHSGTSLYAEDAATRNCRIPLNFG